MPTITPEETDTQSAPPEVYNVRASREITPGHGQITELSGTKVNAATLAGWLTMLLAAWLVISAFAWPHTEAVRTNTWIVGVLMFAAAVWGFITPWARVLSTLLAVWLLITTPFEHHLHPATVWNSVIVALVVLFASRALSHNAVHDGGAVV